MADLALPYVPIDPRISGDPKTRRFCELAGLGPRARGHGYVIDLLLAVGLYEPSGVLPAGISDATLAAWVGWQRDPKILGDALRGAGWLIANGEQLHLAGWERFGGRMLRARERWRRDKHTERKRRVTPDVRTESDLEGEGEGEGGGEGGEKKQHRKKLAGPAGAGPPPRAPEGPPDPEPDPAKKPDPVRAWLLAAAEEASRILGHPYAVAWGQDNNAVKPVLVQLGPDDLTRRWRAFLRDPDEFAQRNRTLRFFASRVNAYAKGIPRNARKGVARAEDSLDAHASTAIGVVTNPWGEQFPKKGTA